MASKDFWLVILIYVSIFWQILEIYILFANADSENDYATIQQYFLDNLLANPPKNLFLASSSSTESLGCPNYTHQIPLFNWPGLASGCLCTSKNTAESSSSSTSFLYNSITCFSSKDMDCVLLSEIEPQVIYSWKNYYICAEYYNSTEIFYKLNSTTTCESMNMTDCGVICSASLCPISAVTFSFENDTVTAVKRVQNYTDNILLYFSVQYEDGPCINPSLIGIRSSNNFFPLEIVSSGCGQFSSDKVYSEIEDILDEKTFFSFLNETAADVSKNFKKKSSSSGLNLFLKFLANQGSEVVLYSRNRMQFIYSKDECKNISLASLYTDIYYLSRAGLGFESTMWIGTVALIFSIAIGPNFRQENTIQLFHIFGCVYYSSVMIRFFAFLNTLSYYLNPSNSILQAVMHDCLTDPIYNRMLGEIQAYYYRNFNVFIGIDMINFFCGVSFVFITSLIWVERGLLLWKSMWARFGLNPGREGIHQYSPLNLHNFRASG